MGYGQIFYWYTLHYFKLVVFLWFVTACYIIFGLCMVKTMVITMIKEGHRLFERAGDHPNLLTVHQTSTFIFSRTRGKSTACLYAVR